ncbi:MAG: putative permease super family [Ignavibacteria bacterium]|nr:putative permease super family [Ignavibacteria bacterium]
MPYIGEIAALSTALFWSFSSYAFTSASIRVGAINLNIYRLIIACILIWATIFCFGLMTSISSEQIIYLTISGIIGLAIGDSFLFKSYQMVGPRISIIVMSASPALTAILAYMFFGEGLEKYAIIGICVTLAGILIVVTEKKISEQKNFKITPRGMLYSALGMLGQTIGLLFAKNAFSTGNLNGFLAGNIRITSTIIFMLPALIFMKRIDPPVKLFSSNKKGLFFVFAGAVLGPYAGITLSMEAIEHTQIGIASTLMSTMPIFMLPLSKFFYGEAFTLRRAVGALLAVAGVLILFLR